MDTEQDTFTSVTWENRDITTPNSQPVFSTTPSFSSNNAIAGPSTTPSNGLARETNDDPTSLTWSGYLMVHVLEPRKELEGQKDAFISYGIRAETNLSHFSRTYMATRRRFNDFTFLREGLKRDFPACVVAPLPDKHRLEYLTGDRFSNEFIEKRTQDLQLFLERICRHPTLQRSQLLRSFLESSEWHVDMHAHTATHSSSTSTSAGASALISGSQVENAGPPSLLDSLSDHFLNAFSKVRKPDERFEEIRESIDKLEEGLAGTERVLSRNRNRIAALPFGDVYAPQLGTGLEDLSTDYEDLATSIEGLGYLESGITEPLNKFASAMLELARLERVTSAKSTDAMLSQMQALLSYARTHKSVLKLRDTKQVDFEELTDYLSGVVSERDRLASLSSPYGAGHGHGGVRGAGISGYLKDKVDHLRGVDEERTRVGRMQRLDGKIKELQDAVTSAHDTSTAFNAEVMKEHSMFHLAKEQELKEILGTHADGQIRLYQNLVDVFDTLLPQLERIRVV
ncbi:related to SNX4 - Sorting NeXin [Melanopsichium pennsylvanicum]|uniref:Sorting nexin-4 n=2 Tax=Melanopsichium pennsylvanicum TaxID=63383 RepID=A0AAJ4XP67_9BASI|nr:related to SNX4-Sorting NeXin [Melanopsichium pennsylvanicum 4]SNX85822.1 related to SNX4 - Sorting NeXin [Melanopsichium pennsylvanicum]